MKTYGETKEKIPTPKLKRIFDIFLSLLLIIATAPLFVLILSAILIDHILRGQPLSSLFYIEKRVSQGELFNFIKFNAFKPRVIAELRENEVFIHTKKLEHDGHSLTLIGRLLQKVYLDELPQLFSIFIGDISFVGPRPVNLEVYKKIVDQGGKTKTIIKAGLTGNFQSQKGITRESDTKLDIDYINFCLNNPSWKIVLYDIKIVLRTFRVIFRAQGI